VLVRTRTLAVALLAVTVAGCGAGGNGSGGSGGQPAATSAAAAPAVQKDDALAKLVPSDIASDGKIVVGSDASYAPNEFVDTDGTTIIGMDVDLGKAIGQKLGLEVEFQNSAFDGILPGIAAKKYELGMSSFTDNAEREKVVDMVTYFSAGTKLAVPKGNPEGIKIDDLCGKTVAVQRGTVQVDDLTARSDTCTKAGKPAINISQFQAQTDVTLALTGKRAQGELADRKPGMMTLISLAIVVAFATSWAGTLRLFDVEIWWELATLITIMLLGHWLEMRSIAQARGALAALAELLPDTAERVSGDRTEEVPTAELRLDDILLVRPGGRVPAEAPFDQRGIGGHVRPSEMNVPASAV